MPKNRPSDPMPQGRWTVRDAVLIVNMALFFAVGVLILWRSTAAVGYLIGGAFLFLGGYRLYLLVSRRGVWNPKSTR